MDTVRFSKIVEAAGRPVVHVLWIDPDKDPILKKAIDAKKVMTVHQGLTTGKADYGTVGFQKGVTAQILIFPKSLERFAEMRVTGVKYDLLDSALVPKGQEAPKIVPAKRVAKGKQQKASVKKPKFRQRLNALRSKRKRPQRWSNSLIRRRMMQMLQPQPWMERK